MQLKLQKAQKTMRATCIVIQVRIKEEWALCYQSQCNLLCIRKPQEKPPISSEHPRNTWLFDNGEL